MIDWIRENGKPEIMCNRVDLYASSRNKEAFKPPCAVLTTENGNLAVEFNDLGRLQILLDEAEEAFIEHMENNS